MAVSEAWPEMLPNHQNVNLVHEIDVGENEQISVEIRPFLHMEMSLRRLSMQCMSYRKQIAVSVVGHN